MQGARHQIAKRLLAVQLVAEPHVTLRWLQLVVAALLPQLVDRVLRVDNELVGQLGRGADLGDGLWLAVALQE